MHDRLGGLAAIPLGMGDHARVIIEHTDQHRAQPASLVGDHRARAFVRIQMPQSVDVLQLEAADFALATPLLGGLPGVARHPRAAAAFVQTLGAGKNRSTVAYDGSGPSAGC